MQDDETSAPPASKHAPWNKGKLIGATPPLRPAVEVGYLAYEVHFPRPSPLIAMTIFWAILAYGGVLILGLPAFYALGFLDVRNHTSV